MSTYESGVMETFHAGVDLSDSLHAALSINATGRCVLATAVSGPIIGHLAMSPEQGVVGEPISVAMIAGGGKMKARAGAAVTRGHLLVADAAGADSAGRLVGVNGLTNIPANRMSCGIALEAATADGDYFQYAALPLFKS